MPHSVSQFYFDESDLPPLPAFVAEIPAGVTAKHALLEQLYQRLHFPDYFGSNWDALEECIRDLSWLIAEVIVLRHHDLPLAGDVSSQKTYLSILRDAVAKKRTAPDQRSPELLVFFPPEYQEQVAWLVREIEHDEAGR